VRDPSKPGRTSRCASFDLDGVARGPPRRRQTRVIGFHREVIAAQTRLRVPLSDTRIDFHQRAAKPPALGARELGRLRRSRRVGELLDDRPRARRLSADESIGCPTRHAQSRLPRRSPPMEADHAASGDGAPAPATVQVDEATPARPPGSMGHARLEPAGDERQVRVAVTRLDGALGGVEITPALQSIVRITRALGKIGRASRCYGEILPGPRRAIRLRSEEAGRRVGRPVEAPRYDRQGVGVLAREARAPGRRSRRGSADSSSVTSSGSGAISERSSVELEESRGRHPGAPTVTTLTKRRDDSQLRRRAAVRLSRRRLSAFRQYGARARRRA